MCYVNCIDDSRNTVEQKEQLINTQRTIVLESVDISIKNSPNTLTFSEVNELKTLINERYNQRIQLVQNNEKLWDYKVSHLMIITGVK